MLSIRLPIHQDPQSVHRQEVLQVHQPILEWLLKTTPEPLCLEETLVRIHCGLLQILKRSKRRTWATWIRAKLGLPDPRVVALLNGLKTQVATSDSLYTVEGQVISFSLILRLVTTKVYSLKNPELGKCFLLELCDGMGQCVGGQAARLLNTFCGFEVAPISDPRTARERVSDEMAALRSRKLEKAEMLSQARAILDENDLPELERLAWLEALEA
jgi:hypothetical protein